MLRALLAERDIPFLLGVYPYGMVAGPDQWASGRVFWGFERGRTYGADLALAVFERFSRESGVPLLNTFPAFRTAAETQKLFYDEDGHMTPAGQRLMADRIVADRRIIEAVKRRRTPRHAARQSTTGATR